MNCMECPKCKYRGLQELFRSEQIQEATEDQLRACLEKIRELKIKIIGSGRLWEKDAARLMDVTSDALRKQAEAGRSVIEFEVRPDGRRTYQVRHVALFF